MALDDLYDPQIAYNPDTEQLVTGAVFQVFAPDDASFTTPLTLTDPASGTGIATLRSSNIGVLPAFKVAGNLPRVIIRSGSFTTLLSSRFGELIEAGFDPEAIAAAVASVPAAEAARDAAIEAKEAAEAVGTTNDAIMAGVAADPDSAFRAQQLATIVGVVESSAAAASVSRSLAVSRVDTLGDAKLRASVARAAKAERDEVTPPADITSITVNGQAAIVRLPYSFDRSAPVPLVIYYHGVGEDQDLSAQEQPMMEAALTAGYAVATCNFHGNGYGSPSVMQDTRDLFDAILQFVPVAGLILAGNSMGGIGALNAVTTLAAPNVLGVYLMEPVVSLRQRYDNGRATEIRSAFGLAVDGSDYAAKTAGYDPALRTGWEFRGIPFHIRSSASDTLVPASAHSNVLAAKLAGYSPVTTSAATGSHSSDSHYDVATFTAFLDSVAGPLAIAATPQLRRIISDTFTGGDDTDIAGRTTDNVQGGSPAVWSIGSGHGNAFAISAGQLVQGTNTASAQAFFNVPENAEVAATIGAAGASPIYLDVRRTPSSTQGYRAEVSASGARLVRRSAGGTATPLSSFVPHTAGQRVAVRAYGSELRLYVGGVLVQTVNDATIAAGSVAGISYGGAGVATVDDFTIDDFVLA